jgi:hypothetical protein
MHGGPVQKIKGADQKRSCLPSVINELTRGFGRIVVGSMFCPLFLPASYVGKKKGI